MADIHPIRLRGPWQYRVLYQYFRLNKQYERITEHSPEDTLKESPTTGKVQMPSDWGEHLGASFRGLVQYTRNFGCPTGLEPHESVFLVLEGVDSSGKIELNGELLGKINLVSGAARFEITGRLLDRNELTVRVDLPFYDSLEEERRQRGDRAGLPGGLIGEVRLEICSGN